MIEKSAIAQASRRMRVRSRGRLLLPLSAAIRLANKLEDVGAMREAIEQGTRQAFTAEDLRPSGETKN